MLVIISQVQAQITKTDKQTSDDVSNGSLSTQSSDSNADNQVSGHQKIITVISLEFCIYLAVLAFVIKVLYEVYLENQEARQENDDRYLRYENAQTFNDNFVNMRIMRFDSQESICDLEIGRRNKQHINNNNESLKIYFNPESNIDYLSTDDI